MNLHEEHSNTLRIKEENIDIRPIHWKSPSNIALVKYWGKYGIQQPCNPSVSFTLNNAHTITRLTYSLKEDGQNTEKNISLNFLFENKPNPVFAKKIIRFLENMLDYFPFLSQLHLNINSFNSFPHSSGIASSASSMSALAACLCDLERELFGTLKNEADFKRKMSFIARLGSGSACRSVYPKAAVWGKTESLANSSQDYAIPFETDLHPVFHDYKDAILIVSRKEKQVSSRAGHGLMNNNPFAKVRYEQANQNLSTLLTVLQNGNLESFVDIVESEALSLHALMMCSKPAFILMQANTLNIIQQVQQFRQEKNIPLCFTLDAGPNVHLLYPNQYSKQVETFIADVLLDYCEDGYWISDNVGMGTSKITEQ